LIDIRGWKAVGNKLNPGKKIKNVRLLASKPENDMDGKSSGPQDEAVDDVDKDEDQMGLFK
ncbi:MAG: hypothetical protein WBH03_08000, partial [Cyclobacteriaceae bacterium]